MRTAVAGVAAAAAGLFYSARIEPRSFRIREHRVPVLPAGADPIRVLHISDLHLAHGQQWRADFVRGLTRLDPDLVLNTGDNLGADVLDEALGAFAPLMEAAPGAFVLGSNDVWAAQLKNPFRYLVSGTTHGEDKSDYELLPTADLVAGFEAGGWIQLDNRRAVIDAGGVRIALAGLGDAHMDAEEITDGHPAFDAGADVRIGITHAPYSRVLEAFDAAGADLVVAGHTHGGQVRIPGWGAPVTNCDLDRTRARGLFPYRRMLVNVSAGLGYSPYSPVRFACPPEVSLLTLVPRG